MLQYKAGQTRLVALILVVTTAFAIVNAVWLPRSTIVLDAANALEVAKVVAVIGALYTLALLVQRRVAEDYSRPANLIKRGCFVLRILTKGATLFVSLAIVTTLFMYLAAATERPLTDQYLAEIDAALGYDWLAFLATANSTPAISSALVFAYHALGPQIPLLFLLLAVTGREFRLIEFVALLAISSVFTGALSAILPAAGAYAYFQPSPDDFSNFTAKAGMWHYQELLLLRSGEPVNFLITRSEGLVTFPSFHTALGILIVYALRDFRLLTGLVGILNAVMIVSTLPEGGHHLIDVLVGLVIAALTIAVVHAIGHPRGSLALVEAKPIADA